MSTSLFGRNIEPACKYCAFAMQVVSSGKEVLCEKRGVVAAGYHCRRYEYDPLRRVPKRPMPLAEFTAEDFSID